MFHDASRLLLSSRPPDIPGHYKSAFFYPPYFIPLIVPLGFFSRTWAYVTLALSMIGAIGTRSTYSDQCCPRKSRVSPRQSWSYFLCELERDDNPGPLQPLYLFILVTSLLLWTRGHRVLAGMVMSLLMFKPNLGLIFPALFIVQRQWFFVSGLGMRVCPAPSSTVPIGLAIWADYFRSYRIPSRPPLPPKFRCGSNRRSTRSCAPLSACPSRRGLWLCGRSARCRFSQLPWQSGSRSNRTHGIYPHSRHRGAGGSLLQRVSVYDGLLLALPGIVWYVRRATIIARPHAIGRLELPCC